MTQAIIYQPAKNAMQSGKAKTKYWLLEFQRSQPMTPDALMGWNTMSETVPQQLTMRFETKEEAVQYAESHGISFVVKAPKAARVPPKAYAENFSFKKRKAF